MFEAINAKIHVVYIAPENFWRPGAKSLRGQVPEKCIDSVERTAAGSEGVHGCKSIF